MNDTTLNPPSTLPARQTWIDLALYLAGGFGLYLIAGIVLGLLMQSISVDLSALVYLLNVLFLGGSFYVLGVRRGKIRWEQNGLWPAIWRWRWLAGALGLSLLMLPVRALLGLGIQIALEGNLDSLQGRTDLLLSGGSFSWSGLIITMIGAGILAPIAEELYFRGLLHGWFRSRLSFWPSVLLSSLLFGLAHFDSVAVIVSSLLLGIVNALILEKKKSLWFPIAIHICTNSVAVGLAYLAMAVAPLIEG